MKIENLKEAIYLKGKESFVVGGLLVVLAIILIIPVGVLFFLRFIFKLAFKAKKSVATENKLLAHEIRASEKPVNIS